MEKKLSSKYPSSLLSSRSSVTVRNDITTVAEPGRISHCGYNASRERIRDILIIGEGVCRSLDILQSLSELFLC